MHHSALDSRSCSMREPPGPFSSAEKMWPQLLSQAWHTTVPLKAEHVASGPPCRNKMLLKTAPSKLDGSAQTGRSMRLVLRSKGQEDKVVGVKRKVPFAQLLTLYCSKVCAPTRPLPTRCHT